MLNVTMLLGTFSVLWVRTPIINLHSCHPMQPGSVATVEETQQLYGNMTLYFGCRQSEMDFIYKEELKCAEESGALSAVHVALSRQPAQPKVSISYNNAGLQFEFLACYLQTYVQDLLKENADMVVKDLLEESGHIYVCGDISMAASVRKTVQVCSVLALAYKDIDN